MERIELLKERIKRGYYTAALDDLREILKTDPENKEVLELIEEAVKNYVDYARDYIDDRLIKHIDTELEKNNFYKSLFFPRKIHRINVYAEDLLKNFTTLSKKQKRFVKKTLKWIENIKPTLYEKETNVVEARKKFLAEMGEDFFKEKSNRVKMRLEKPIVDKPPENEMEYIPEGICTLKIRVSVTDPSINNIVLRPKTTAYDSENAEFSKYVLGVDDANTNADIRKDGLWIFWGGGSKLGFYMEDVPAESFAYFFVRHRAGAEPQTKSYSVTIIAEEELENGLLVPSGEQTFVFHFPKNLQGNLDYVRPIYERISADKIEIRFSGNKIPLYNPRWFPIDTIKYVPYNPIDLKVIHHRKGTVELYRNDEKIGKLFGHITDDIFFDPMRMVVPELFSFIAPSNGFETQEEFIAVRAWYFWIDKRIREHPWYEPVYWEHELPDFERVDFILRPEGGSEGGWRKDQTIVPYIVTDVHWKEFWLGCEDAKLPIDVKFLTLGIDPVHWRKNKQVRVYFFHKLGIFYNPLPAVTDILFTEKRFYCIKCGTRTNYPLEIEGIKYASKKEMGRLNFGSSKYDKLIDDILNGPNFVCPGCGEAIKGLEKLNYIALFGEWKPHKYNNLLKDVTGFTGPSMFTELSEKFKALGESIGSLGTTLRTNCHVPAPKEGRTSHELCSSSMIKPVPKSLEDY